jgi:hypothetical protein
VTRSVGWDFTARDVNASRTANKVSRAFDKAGGGIDKTGKRLTGIKTAADAFGSSMLDVSAITAGAGVAAFAFWKSAFEEARDAAKVGRQTEAVIRSTGGAANITAQEVGRLAESISNKVGVDDEAIQSGENLLLTFTRVRNEAGKGNDIFNQATMAIVDMTAAMNGGEVSAEGLKASTIQVGKALNDPIKGMTALKKVGVSFTESQQDQIKALVKSGKTMEAQKIILRELQTEFSGSAEASTDSMQKLSVQIDNIKEDLGTGLLPAAENAASALGKLADGFNKLNDRQKSTVSNLAVFGPVVGFATGAWNSLQVALGRTDKSQQDVAGSAKAAGSAEGKAAVAAEKAKEAHKKQAEAVKKAKEEFYKERAAIASVIPAFEGYNKKSDVTKSKILSNLRQEVSAYRTWAADTRTLLKRGADPAVVKALSDKGPQYVHAFVSASGKELQDLNRLFKSRTQAAGAVAITTAGQAGAAMGRAAARGFSANFHPVFAVPRAGSGSKPFKGQRPKAYASGGVISEPVAGIGLRTGSPYSIGERGPEAVVPMTGRSGAPNTYSISVAVGPGGNPAEVGARVVSAIKEYERRSGTSWRR